MRWLRHCEEAIAAGPPAHHLSIWDALSARRRVPAIGGLDATAVRRGTVRRDGVPIHEERSEMLDVEIEEAGVCRLEARIDDRRRLLSNPVHLC